MKIYLAPLEGITGYTYRRALYNCFGGFDKYFIPFILSNVASILIAYGAFAIGIVPKCTGLAQVPWTTPLLISGYLATNSIMGAVLQLVCVIVVVLIWLPFVKVADTQIQKEEAQEN